MPKLNLSEAAAEILKKSINDSVSEPPKAIKDPEENDTGEAVTKPTDGKKDYAKNVKKDTSEPTKNAAPAEKSELPLTKEAKDSEDDEMVDGKDEVEVDGEEVKSKKKKESDSKDDMKEDRTSLESVLDKHIQLDVSEDIKKMFGDTELSEEFKEKAATIFEAACRRKIKQVSSKLAEEADKIIAAEVEKIEEELSEGISDFMKLVGSEWLQENEVEIESNLRSEITEGFIVGMRNLFAEHYVDVPDEKRDLVSELVAKNEELEGSLNEELSRKLEEHKYIKELEAKIAFNEIVEQHNLTVSNVEKLRGLTEGLDFDNADKYKNKINTLIETYINVEETSGKSEKRSLAEEVSDSTEVITIDAGVKAMADALGKRNSRK